MESLPLTSPMGGALGRMHLTLVHVVEGPATIVPFALVTTVLVTPFEWMIIHMTK